MSWLRVFRSRGSILTVMCKITQFCPPCSHIVIGVASVIFITRHSKQCRNDLNNKLNQLGIIDRPLVHTMEPSCWVICTFVGHRVSSGKFCGFNFDVWYLHYVIEILINHFVSIFLAIYKCKLQWVDLEFSGLGAPNQDLSATFPNLRCYFQFNLCSHDKNIKF